VNTSRIFDQLGRLPRSQRLLLFGLVYTIIIGVYLGLLYLPAETRISDLRDEETSLNEQKVQLEQRIRDKERYEAELQTLMSDLKEALKELPNDREIPGLLKAISGMGKKAGLDIEKFQPLKEERLDYVAEVPVALQVSGSYHEVALFFDHLSNMNRIVYVRDLEMGSPSLVGGKVRLKVSGNAVTFRFLSDNEVQVDKKKKKKRGGKR